MAYAQPRIHPAGERNAQFSLGCWDTNGSPNYGQTTRTCDSQQQQRERERERERERTCHIVDFTVLAAHKVKFKEREKCI